MRIPLLIIVILLFAVNAHAAIIDNIVSYWKMDEGSGNIIDAHGNHDGVATGTVSYSETGKINTSIDMAGTGYFTDSNITEIENVQNFSVSVWVYFNSLTDWQGILDQIRSGAGTEGFNLMSAGATLGDNNDILVGIKAGDNTYAHTAGDFISTGSWYHIVVAYDGTQGTDAGKVKLYINGDSKTLTFSDNPPATIGTSGEDFIVGYNSGNFVTLDGKVDEVGVWDKTLSPTEVGELYNAGAGLPFHGAVWENLISYWKLDESSGNAADSFGSNTGTVGGSVTQGATGKIGTAYAFDAADETVNVGDDATIKPTGEMTISVWIYPTSENHLNIFTKEGDVNDWVAYALAMNNSQEIVFDLAKGSLSDWARWTTDNAFAINNWHHVIVAWKHTGTIADDVKIYIDGEDEAFSTGGAGYDAGFVIGYNAHNTEMGNWNIDNRSNPFIGTIDEVAFYSKQKSAADAATLWNGGTGLTYPVAGWSHDFGGVANASIAKIGGIDIANIAKVGGVE